RSHVDGPGVQARERDDADAAEHAVRAQGRHEFSRESVRSESGIPRIEPRHAPLVFERESEPRAARAARDGARDSFLQDAQGRHAAHPREVLRHKRPRGAGGILELRRRRSDQAVRGGIRRAGGDRSPCRAEPALRQARAGGVHRIRAACGARQERLHRPALREIVMPFSKLDLSPKVLEGVAAAGYTDPTPIQLRAIPLVLAGRDLIGSAQTGTGKTAAFALPILTRLDRHGPLRTLVLEPTRELAAQVETAIRDYGRFTDLRTAVVFGGTGYGRQDEALKKGVDILVATPGRLLDQMQRGMVKLDKIEILVLDEADRMLDMGFMPDVRRIVERCPKDRQTMLFSATIPPEIDQLCKWALRNPETVEVGVRRSPAETVTHALYPV